MAVVEDLEEDVVILVPVEYKVHVGAHGDLTGAAPGGDIVRVRDLVTHAVEVQEHHQGKDGVVVAEAEIGTLLAGGDAFIGPGDNVLDDGHISIPGGPCVPVELEVVRFP